MIQNHLQATRFAARRVKRSTTCAALISIVLAACSGGQDGNNAGAGSGLDGIDRTGAPIGEPVVSDEKDSPTTEVDASRLLQQATFGPTAALIDEVQTKGPRKFLIEQFAQPASRYRYTLPVNQYRDQIHSQAKQDFCAQFSGQAANDCWRDWFSSIPVEWDFYRQAVSGRDQLRQRTAFALSQIFVTSGKELTGSYGFAQYQQMLRDNAFTDIRTLLHEVTLSPFMGAYLNMVNNEAEDPNENYARELLQLFSLGTCLLNPDGSLQSGQCIPTYDNLTVRNYAFALTGWTYPDGGINPWCNECTGWKNPAFFRGTMKPVASQHDDQDRVLLAGITAPAGRSPAQGLNAVIDSIMAHPNLAPFISRQLIQFLVTSNPQPDYLARVSAVFNSGVYTAGGTSIGSGRRGDMRATLAAILLDEQARSVSHASTNEFGRLRAPVLFVTGAIRAMDGETDGEPVAQWEWGNKLGQPVFNAPSVFNFYPPDYPLSNTNLVAPQFGIENTNSTLARLNFANALIYWWYDRGDGRAANPTIPDSIGTRLSYTALESLIEDPETDSIKVVQALNALLVDQRLNNTQMQTIATAMDAWQPSDTWLTRDDTRSTWQRERVKTALYLVLASPSYQIQR